LRVYFDERTQQKHNEEPNNPRYSVQHQNSQYLDNVCLTGSFLQSADLEEPDWEEIEVPSAPIQTAQVDEEDPYFAIL
jgi:hypothetical protein